MSTSVVNQHRLLERDEKGNYKIEGVKKPIRSGMKITNAVLFGIGSVKDPQEGSLLHPDKAKVSGDYYEFDEKATEKYLADSEAQLEQRALKRKQRELSGPGLVASLMGIAAAKPVEEAPAADDKVKLLPAAEVIAEINKATTIEEVDALIEGDDRKGVNSAAAKKKEELNLI